MTVAIIQAKTEQDKGVSRPAFYCRLRDKYKKDLVLKKLFKQAWSLTFPDRRRKIEVEVTINSGTEEDMPCLFQAFDRPPPKRVHL